MNLCGKISFLFKQSLEMPRTTLNLDDVDIKLLDEENKESFIQLNETVLPFRYPPQVYNKVLAVDATKRYSLLGNC